MLHDLAQEVAGDEIVVANCLGTNKLGKAVHHLFLDGGKCTENSFSECNIHTCYMDKIEISSTLMKTLVSKWSRLRTLRMRVRDSESLPESIGKLVHLRYLDLSYSWELKRLPNSITMLYNLQSLILTDCGLIEWPKNFCKLVYLRMLNIEGCTKLNYMPSGIGQLTNLRVLREYRMCNVGSSGKQYAGLEDLKSLTHLTGYIDIMFEEYEDLTHLTGYIDIMFEEYEDLASEKDTSGECSCLEHMQNLKMVRIILPTKNSLLMHQTAVNEAVLAKLKPHRNLMHLNLYSYRGAEIPKWGRVVDDWGAILPHLVTIVLNECHQLHGLPLLKVLSIDDCTRLKGWWRGVGEGDRSSSGSLPSFPRLHILTISFCSQLISFPPCPTLRSLNVKCVNESLRIITGEDSGNSDINIWLESIDTVGFLKTLPASRLRRIMIEDDDKIKSLAEIEDVFKISCCTLRSLTISECRNLTGLSGALEHLTALESLILNKIPRVDDEDDSGMPRRSLHQNLLSLKLMSVDNMKTLPQGLKYLTSLQKLTIAECNKLTGLPEWISCLSSLHSLKIKSCPNIKSLPAAIQNLPSLHSLLILGCPDLSDAGQEPSGQDWPKIRHIPHIVSIPVLDDSYWDYDL
ncbi:hypothetical protein RND81_03G049300 [Saponaria officinalis]|uniref:Disease resistance R13L4/SHOC-2-like LRR domain-containing protein n=1 Tax=Saponaria officinalis TaxID=3572 RepID=A0AAW1LYR6_SAPOF